jgi:hypothetical protein
MNGDTEFVEASYDEFLRAKVKYCQERKQLESLVAKKSVVLRRLELLNALLSLEGINPDA